MTTEWPSGEPATLTAYDMEYRAKMSKDDAILMSASPHLLAACMEARDELRHPDHTPGDWSVQVVLKQLDEAIAAAKGV